jgi:hypothetical protein
METRVTLSSAHHPSIPLLAEEPYPLAFSISSFNSSMEVTVSLLLWAMAWQLAHNGSKSLAGSIFPSYFERGLIRR